MSTVSNNIKYLRRMNGLTQEQFARKIGIKRSLLGAYEEARANPNLENLMNIAKIFGTTVDNLLKNDLRTLKETRGVPLPQPSQQLAIKEEPEPPKQLASLIDKYYRPSTGNTPYNTNKPVEKPTSNPDPSSQRIAYQPINSTLPPAPVVSTPLPPSIPASHFTTATSPTHQPLSQPTSPTDKNKQPIEWVKQPDIAEYLSSYAYADYLKQLPVFQMPVLPQGKYRAFEAGSDFPLPGAVIIGQFVNNWYDIKDGHQYIVVVHKQGILYRRIYNQVKIKGTLLLSADNPAITSVEISIKEVLEVWEAKAYVSLQMPEPSVGPSLERLHELVMMLQMEIERLKK